MKNPAKPSDPLDSLIVIMIVTLIGLYSTKRECMEIGGTTARGLFWLECIK
jgi:uncharacterized membrane protein